MSNNSQSIQLLYEDFINIKKKIGYHSLKINQISDVELVTEDSQLSYHFKDYQMTLEQLKNYKRKINRNNENQFQSKLKINQKMNTEIIKKYLQNYISNILKLYVCKSQSIQAKLQHIQQQIRQITIRANNKFKQSQKNKYQCTIFMKNYLKNIEQAYQKQVQSICLIYQQKIKEIYLKQTKITKNQKLEVNNELKTKKMKKQFLIINEIMKVNIEPIKKNNYEDKITINKHQKMKLQYQKIIFQQKSLIKQLTEQLTQSHELYQKLQQRYKELSSQYYKIQEKLSNKQVKNKDQKDQGQKQFEEMESISSHHLESFQTYNNSSECWDLSQSDIRKSTRGNNNDNEEWSEAMINLSSRLFKQRKTSVQMNLPLKLN